MAEIIFKEECYEIIGCCFEVFNNLGPGHREKTYQKALEKVIKSKEIEFKSQLYIPLKIKDIIVGKQYIDLLYKDIIAIEIKVGNHFYRKDIEQLYSYLKATKLKLGLLINFTSSAVLYKRILNIK